MNHDPPTQLASRLILYMLTDVVFLYLSNLFYFCGYRTARYKDIFVTNRPDVWAKSPSKPTAWNQTVFLKASIPAKRALFDSPNTL